MRMDQIEALDSIESITDGASSRRNQLLVDLGSELDLGAIDGAAEADLAGLRSQVTKLARTYKPYGPVLSDAINDQLRTVLGPSGKRPAAIAERVKKTWELGDGWAKHVTVEVALGTREGSSVRGGSLGGLHDGALADAATVDKVIDAAVTAVAGRRGIAVALPSAGGAAGGGVVDSAALTEFAEQVTGRDGVLASAARLGAQPAGSRQRSFRAGEGDRRRADRSGYRRTRFGLAAFGGAGVRRPQGGAVRRPVGQRARGPGEAVADGRGRGRRQLAACSPSGSRVRATSSAPRPAGGRAGPWPRDATCTRRCSAVPQQVRRIRARVATATRSRWSPVRRRDRSRRRWSLELLDGGATVIATTSKLDDTRLAFYRNLYRDNARFGAALWVVPANMASYSDIDALVQWVGNEQTESLGPQSIHLKDAQTPTLLFPFAAPRVAGDLSEAGSRSEMEMKVLLWAVQRLIGGLSRIGSERDIASRLHVVLPGSPNRGMFGGDGAYGESKSALDAVVARWKAESSWAQRVSLAHALIGWTRGTGLMGANDAIVNAVEEAGVTTYSTEQMAAMLLDLCDIESKVAAAQEPLKADLTGGLGDIDIDMSELAAKAREEMASRVRRGQTRIWTARSPRCPRRRVASPLRRRRRGQDLDVDPADLVVIVGGAELGPYGSSRTRFEMEVDDELSAAGVLELAWTTGLIKWEDDPKPGWYDTESGDLVDESELVERYHDAVVENDRHPRVRRRRRDRPRSRVTASGIGVPRQGLHLRGVVGGRRARVRRVRPGAHRCHSGAGQQRLAGHPQGGHRDPGAAQDQAVADRRRADSHRVRSDGVGHQPGHGQLDRPGRAVEHRGDRRRVPRRRLHADRADALGAPEPWWPARRAPAWAA